MTERLELCIADITIAVSSLDLDLKFWVGGENKKFIVEEVEPNIKLWVSWSELCEEISGEKIFDSGLLWKLYELNGFYLFRFASPALGSSPYKIAKMQKDFKCGEVFLHRPYFDPGLAVYPLEYPLDELLFINFLAMGKGVEIHASGVIDLFGQGHLFVGQSGAGKTMMANLWKDAPGITVLSDDRIILRKMENTIWMYGTPWHGEAGLASPAKALLTGIYFLEHGEENKLVLHKPAPSLGRLFACIFPPFYSREGVDFTLGFLEDVVRKVPCYELRFKPDKSVVELITNNEHFHMTPAERKRNAKI